ncbi:uncharacterized protein KRP23_13726 [Phytophthora ramorum]|uniref:uncharacterized protein n=1 Tax=Phytophthora ramorum TaxID=164328 RepID=UPI0030A25FF8|nr:hypothetical protein KRP23_13726 [Phytophthora ramorum]
MERKARETQENVDANVTASRAGEDRATGGAEPAEPAAHETPDSEWSDTDESPVASSARDDDYETHESCEDGGVDEEDLSVYLIDESLAAKASRLIKEDPCEAKRLGGKETNLGNFFAFCI